MSSVLPFVIAGLTAGSIYALAGVGLVLTYRTSGVFNFAHGALATVSAYLFYTLHVSHGWGWPVAALVSVLGVGTLLGLVMAPFADALRRATLAESVAATVGLLLVVESAIKLLYDPTRSYVVPRFLGSGSFEVAGVHVPGSDLITLLFALVVSGLLATGLKRSRTGIATQALVNDPQLLGIIGRNAQSVRRLALVVVPTLACASGVLFAPLLPLDPTQLTLFVVASFGATAIGGFRSIPLTCVGGLAIGVGVALAGNFFSESLSGLAASLPFAVLFLVLLLFRRRWLGTPIAAPSVTARPQWQAPDALRLFGSVLLITFLASVPGFAGYHLNDWTAGLATMLSFLALGTLVHTSGQVSLSHVTFIAIGAAAFCHLAVDKGVPWTLALLAAGLIAVPIGILLAVPAIRLSGLYLALLTFGFGILVQNLFYAKDLMFGITGLGLTAPRPTLGGGPAGDRAYFYLVLAIVVAVSFALWVLDKNRLGRLLRGMRDSTTVLETSGASTRVTKVIVFSLYAFLTALAGALAASAQGIVSVQSYPPLLSLSYLVVLVLLAGRSLMHAFLGAFFLVVFPAYLPGGQVNTYLQVVFGLSAVLLPLVPLELRGINPALKALLEGAASGMSAFVRPVRDSVAGASGRAALSGVPTQPTSSQVIDSEAEGLRVSGLTISFGGIHALRDVTFEVPLNQITGLIGPNGAGKTSSFNACSGLNRRAQGRITLSGRDLGGLGPDARARRGLGRTFQRMEVFESMTVRENVALGRESAFAGFVPWRYLVATRQEMRAVRDATEDVLTLCGLTEFADQPVAGLSTGQRRLVDLGRCLAGRFQVLLLDEPSSGLDRAETERFGEILQRVVDERGVGVLLVEHDTALVMRLCAHIYVLDFGKLIFEGTPAEVAASSIVQAAYLGDLGDPRDSAAESGSDDPLAAGVNP